ncbi:hypothetical protein GCM10022383_18930 [Microbacterium soli]|uniref:N-acetyltransferase domain-containing protein n=2 Tax=Microbacterium soli TaxID=446075 RepID=A0ABP7NC75_9MICO
MLTAGGALLAAGLVLAVAVMAVPDGAPGAVDADWNRLMVRVRQPWMVDAARVLDVIGGGWAAALLGPVLIIGVLLMRRRARSAVYAAAALAISAGLVQSIKGILGRARPEDLLVSSDFGSFPSGHTANAATVAVVLALLFPRRWVVAVGVCGTAMMALSRTILSVHWLTDTIGGMLLGAAAALLVAAAVGGWASIGWTRGPASEQAEAGEGPVPSIRPYRPSDLEAVYDVCVRTADGGADARGILADDRLWGDVFAVPYVQRHPDLAWVVESGDGRAVGYLVATDDTEAFETWFRDEWWPGVAARYPTSGSTRPTRQDELIGYAGRRGPGREPHAARYPAHLHIDLLPETQGQGLGRELMQTLLTELRRRGVAGVHLGMNPDNTGAGAFYERLGMSRLESGPDSTMYGLRLD